MRVDVSEKYNRFDSCHFGFVGMVSLCLNYRSNLADLVARRNLRDVSRSCANPKANPDRPCGIQRYARFHKQKLSCTMFSVIENLSLPELVKWTFAYLKNKITQRFTDEASHDSSLQVQISELNCAHDLMTAQSRR